MSNYVCLFCLLYFDVKLVMLKLSRKLRQPIFGKDSANERQESLLSIVRVQLVLCKDRLLYLNLQMYLSRKQKELNQNLTQLFVAYENVCFIYL